MSSNPTRASTNTAEQPPQPHTLRMNEEHGNSTAKFIHGSCRRCNHLNRGIPFDIPQDDSEHARFLCEKCHYPMFGIGRASTQTTLASADTVSLDEHGEPRPRNLRICTDHNVCDASSGARLTPLTEHSPSSQQSQSPAVGPDERATRTNQDAPVSSCEEATPQIQAINPSSLAAEHSSTSPGPSPSSRFRHFQNLRGRIKSHVYKHSRLVRTLGRKLAKRNDNGHGTKAGGKIKSTNNRQELQHKSGQSPPNRPSDAPQQGSTPSPNPDTETRRLTPVTTQSGLQGEQHQSHAITETSGEGEDPSAQRPRSSKTHVYQRRRERTLRSAVLWHKVCECGTECLCKYETHGQNNNGRTIDHSSAAIGIEGSSGQPEHDQGSDSHASHHQVLPLPEFYLTSYLGDQFRTGQHASNPRNESIDLDSDPVTTAFSQATTQLGTDDARSASTNVDRSISRPSSSATQNSAPNIRQNPGLGHVLDGINPSDHDQQARAASPLRQSTMASESSSDTSRLNTLSLDSEQPAGLREVVEDQSMTNGHLDPHGAILTDGLSGRESEEVTPTTVILHTRGRGLSDASAQPALAPDDLSRRLEELAAEPHNV